VDELAGDRIAEPPTPAVAREIHADFRAHMVNRTRLPWLPRQLMRPALSRVALPAIVPLVEKTPANMLRVPFLRALFPGARFVFLMRRGEDVVSSLMEGWTRWTGRTPWSFDRWHYLVPPGWRAMCGESLEHICAWQWAESNRIALQDLGTADDYLTLRFEDLLANPVMQYRRLLAFADLPPSRTLDQARARPRVVTNGGSAPRAGKWRDLHADPIRRVRHLFAPLHRRWYPEAEA
jgi:hypothetical protein